MRPASPLPWRAALSLAVAFPAIADGDHRNHQPLILDHADDLVVADATRPEITFVTAQGLAELARITARYDALLEVLEQPALDRAVELAQLAPRIGPELNRPGQALS